MKLIVFFLISLFVFSCQAKEHSETIQKELFPYLKKNATDGSKRCELSFAKMRDEELSVFCLPPKKEDPFLDSEYREWARSEVEKLTMKWIQLKKIQMKSLRVRFTDEIAAEEKK